MPTVLVATDAPWVRDQVCGALVGPRFEVRDVGRGQDVRGEVAARCPDVVIADMQIGNMGGMAVSLDLRLEESAGRLPHVPILLLLDREADRFLARSSQADAMLIKPVDPGTLRRTVKRLIAEEEARRRAEAEEEAAGEGDDEQEAGAVEAAGARP